MNTQSLGPRIENTKYNKTEYGIRDRKCIPHVAAKNNTQLYPILRYTQNFPSPTKIQTSRQTMRGRIERYIEMLERYGRDNDERNTETQIKLKSFSFNYEFLCHFNSNVQKHKLHSKCIKSNLHENLHKSKR